MEGTVPDAGHACAGIGGVDVRCLPEEVEGCDSGDEATVAERLGELDVPDEVASVHVWRVVTVAGVAGEVGGKVKVFARLAEEGERERVVEPEAVVQFGVVLGMVSGEGAGGADVVEVEVRSEVESVVEAVGEVEVFGEVVETGGLFCSDSVATCPT